MSSESCEQFLLNLVAIYEDWQITEVWVKKGEQWGGDVIIPAINELRYAGRQVHEAVSSHNNGDDPAARDHIREAKKNLFKARHDVVDALVAYTTKRSNAIRERLGAEHLQEKFHDYGELFGLLKTVQEKIAFSRSEEKDRDKIYTDIMDNDLPKLQKYYEALAASSTAIYKRIKQENLKLRKEHKTAKIMFWIGACGLIFGAINVINRIFW